MLKRGGPPRPVIVSHAHRFIFFAVPRTGTHAVRRALEPHLAADDWRQQNLHGAARLPIPALAARRHGHLSVSEVRGHLHESVWRSYFKFAFVRNPFDRFVSACFFLHRGRPEFARAPTLHMKRALSFTPFRRRVLIRPQRAMLDDGGGGLGVDYVGRFETLDASMDEIRGRIGLPALTLEKANASERGHYAAYYDAELERMVADFYADDLRAFGYRFEVP